MLGSPDNQPEHEPTEWDEFAMDTEQFYERTKGVELALDVLKEAKHKDNLLLQDDLRRQTEETELSSLSRRFAVSMEGGTSEFPFNHAIVVLQLNKNATYEFRNMQPHQAIVMRFGLSGEVKDQEPTPNGRVVITYVSDRRDGEPPESFLLSDVDYRQVTASEDFLVEKDELKGLANGEQVSEFSADIFKLLIDSYEPTLQLPPPSPKVS